VPDPVSESDLLALIEGTLTSSQVSEIQELLRADPVLRARIERMAADRASLSRLPDALPAPSRTVEAAMRSAADSAHRAESGTSHRRTAMVVAAVVGITILAGVFAFIVRATNPTVRANRIANAARESSPPIKIVEPDSGVTGPDPEPDPDAPVTTTAEDIQARFASLESETESEDDPVLKSFLDNIPDQSAESVGVGLSDGEIVALVREGALAVRLTIDPDASPGAIDHASAAGTPSSPTPARPVPGSLTVNIPENASDETILSALHRATESLRARSGIHVEFVRAPLPEPNSPALTTDPDRVLWWSAPSDQWHTVRSRTVPVIVLPNPASSDAPQPPASG